MMGQVEISWDTLGYAGIEKVTWIGWDILGRDEIGWDILG